MTKTTTTKATTKATKSTKITEKSTKSTKTTTIATKASTKSTKTKSTKSTKTKSTKIKVAKKPTKSTKSTKASTKSTKTATKSTKTTTKSTKSTKHPIHIVTFIDGVTSPSKCAQKTLPDLLDHLLDWSKQMDHGRSYYAYRKAQCDKKHQSIDDFWGEIIKTLRLYEYYAWPLSGHLETGKPYRLGVLKTKTIDIVGLCYTPVHDSEGNVLDKETLRKKLENKLTTLNSR